MSIVKGKPINSVKNQFWQMVRGICILAVIMIHCQMQMGGTARLI